MSGRCGICRTGTCCSISLNVATTATIAMPCVTVSQWRAWRGIYLTSRRRSRGDNARRFEQTGVRLLKTR